MLLRSLATCLVASWGIAALPPAQAATRRQLPAPFKIYLTVEDERDEQVRDSIRKLRVHEDRLTGFVDELKARGVEWDDPALLLLQRQIRDIRRRIWRLERDRFN
jgi:hypothetical protein